MNPVMEVLVVGGPGSDFAAFGVPTTDASGRYFAAGAGGPGQVIDLETRDLVYQFDDGISTLTADGSRLLAGGLGPGSPLELRDLPSNDQLWEVQKTVTRAWFSSDERQVYAASLDGSTYLLDAGTGEELLHLVGQGGAPNGATMSVDGRRLATFSTDFSARVWDLAPMRSEGATYVTSSEPRVRVVASADLAEDVAAVWGGAPHQEESLWETVVIDLNTRETLATVRGGAPTLSPDGRRLAYRAVEMVDVAAVDLSGSGDPGNRPRVGPVRIIDVATGELILEINLPASITRTSRARLFTAHCGSTPTLSSASVRMSWLGTLSAGTSSRVAMFSATRRAV